MDLKLAGKRALVTGSSDGIGVGIAKTLAEEGVSVVVTGRNRERGQGVVDAITAAGGEACLTLGDLDTAEGCDAVARAALAAYGGIDILVNNTGGRVETATAVGFDDVSPEQWNETYNRNVTSAVRLIRAIAPNMKSAGWGRIIQISSASAATPTAGGVMEYSATKAALLNLSLGLSKLYANSGVTVNTISPGMIATPSLEGWFDMVATQNHLAGRDEAVRWVLDNTVKQTVDRLGLPEDIGYAVAFMCSPRGDFINGAYIRVDGGCSPAIN